MRQGCGLALREFALLALAAPALGQDTGSITGSVRDASGTIVPGATANVTKSENGVRLRAGELLNAKIAFFKRRRER